MFAPPIFVQMIVINYSGRRSIPFYKVPLATLKEMHESAGRSFKFDNSPAFELVALNTESITAVKRVNYVTAAETPITPDTNTTFDYNGSTYTVYKVPETAVPVGIYYYAFNIGATTYYSETFFVQSCTFDCHLEYSHPCTSFLTGSDTHVNKLMFNYRRFRVDGIGGFEDSRTNGEGEINQTIAHRRTKYKLEILGNTPIQERLNYLSLFQDVQFRIHDVIYPVKFGSIEVEADEPDEDEFTITILFELDEIDEIVDCECSGYDVTPGGGGDPLDPCAGLSVSIDSSSYPTLSAVITGTPTTPRNSKWYRNGKFVSSQEQITGTSESAIYLLVVDVEGCEQKTSTFEHINECDAFTIVPSVVVDVINANFQNIPVGETVSVKVYNPSSVEVATALPYTAVVSGAHTIEATAGQCVKTYSAFVDINDPNSCDHVAAINVNGDVFEGVVTNVTGSPTITYRWTLKDENGLLTQVATTQNYTPLSTGNYIFTAIIDGCEKSDDRFFVKSQRVEIIKPVNILFDNRERYQVFKEANSGFNGTFQEITVTKGTLPDLTGLDPNDIDDASEIYRRIQVFDNSGRLTYVNTLTFGTQFTIVTGNKIRFYQNIGEWQIIHVFFLEDPQ